MKKQSGFSMIEVIATLVLTGSIGLFVYAFLMTGVDGYMIAQENAVVTGEVKPAFDYMSTRMSDMMDIVCFTQDAQIQFDDTNSDLSEVAADITLIFGSDGKGDNIRITNTNSGQRYAIWNVKDRELRMTTENGNVRTITLTFTYEGPNQLEREFSMEFSPRRLINATGFTACSS